jgi:radical SAM protein with 4Fe4S-binding SPASM domain
MDSGKITSRLAPSFLPATAVLEMTYECNHQCLFCSCPWEAKGNGFERRDEMSSDQWMKTISTLTQMGVCSIAFTGGEPLMKKDIFKIIEYAASCQSEHIETENEELVTRFAPPKLYLISNGRIVNDEVLDICKKFDVHLSMSLPGLTTYNDHTKQGNPQHIIELFHKAKAKGVSTTVNITVTKKNIFELYETISEALLAGADTLLMNRFLPGGRGIKYADDLLLTTEQTNEMLDIAEEVLSTANRFGSVGTELPKCILKRNDYVHLKVGTQCSAAIDFFVVGPSGYIRTCNHSPLEVGHISEIENVKQNDYWKKFVMKNYHPHMCNDCELLFDCDGGCREAAHIFSGEINSPDPLFSGCMKKC